MSTKAAQCIQHSSQRRSVVGSGAGRPPGSGGSSAEIMAFSLDGFGEGQNCLTCHKQRLKTNHKTLWPKATRCMASPEHDIIHLFIPMTYECFSPLGLWVVNSLQHPNWGDLWGFCPDWVSVDRQKIGSFTSNM